MFPWVSGFRDEVRHVAQLAGPLVLAELGWMAMGLVDTMMVGRVGAAAMGAVSLSGILFYTVAIFGSGLLLGLDTRVSQAFGARDIEDCRRSLLDGLWLAVLLTPVLTGLVWLWVPFLDGFGIHPAVLREALPYLRAIPWSTLPLLAYTALRRYLQGMNRFKPVMFSLVSANLVNVAVNWILIYGNLGAPRMGAEGAGWATTISRVYMVAVLAVYAALDPETRASFRKPAWPRLGRLLALGLPAASQLSLEVGVWAVVTAMIGRLNPESLAAHQVALTIVSMTFMVPLGIGSAGGVRVGQALGRGDPRAAGRSGWMALALGAAFMSCAAVALLTVPGIIARGFTTDGSVIELSASLLFVAAFFQLFDGLQVVTTGTLRGTGDTRTPMFCHMLGYWAIGLPLGYFLGVSRGWGAVGLWIGLCVALILIGAVLLWVWHRTVRLLEAQCAPL
ncbi:MAG: MATE family efflux transporter [Acidobacteria bacterium]|nr:MATE family efflux transporter [Acidobacteriota bacterium]